MVGSRIFSKSQARGNSGVFMQDKYEVQILDSYANETYVQGQAASIYKQTAPLVNAMRKPGEWSYSLAIARRPKCTDQFPQYMDSRTLIEQ